jgi:hypothetical protein
MIILRTRSAGGISMKMGKKTAWVFIMIAFIEAASSGTSQNMPTVKPRSYSIPRHGKLILNLPDSWKQHIDRSHKDLPSTIELTPNKGDEFIVLITPLYGAPASPDFNKPPGLKRLITGDLEQMLPSAVEKEIAIQEFKGVDSAGYYFFVTDKAPKPGDYPFAVRAIAGVGDLLLSVTVLCRTKDSAAITATVKALQEVRQERE